MLTIINRENLKGKDIQNGNINYYIEGVYESQTHYQIHLRSYDKTIRDELLVLLRNPKEETWDGAKHKYYDLYDSNNPEKCAGLIGNVLKNKDSVIKCIEHIITK